MRSLNERLQRVDTITFDCYGTLVDWRAGLGLSLASSFGSLAKDCLDELFEAYVAAEAKIEAGPYRIYREVVAQAVERVADQFEVEVPAERAIGIADEVPGWAPFADTCEALSRLKQKVRLGVLSNIDADLFAGTSARLGVEFDFVVTAQDVKSYKPAFGHFERLLDNHAKKENVLHVAQSLYHDGLPAMRLGLAFVWINRYKEVNETAVRPLATFANLSLPADAVCGC